MIKDAIAENLADLALTVKETFDAVQPAPEPTGRPAEQLRPGDDLSKGGVKADDGKIRYDLLPNEAVQGLAEVLTYGARKYAPRNWEQGMDWSRPYGAAFRHLLAWWGGEDLDPDTGLSHLAHASANLAFLQAYQARSVGTDDRPNV